MSINRLAESTFSPTSMVKEDRPDILLLPTDSPSTFREVSSSALNQVYPTMTTQRAAPQIIQASSSLSAGRPSLSSQPPLAILLPTQLPAQPMDVPGSAAPTRIAISVTSVIGASPASSDQYMSSSVISSFSTPSTTSAVTLTSTTTVSSSAEVAAAATSTTSTITESPPSTSSAASSSDSSTVDQGHHAPFYIVVVVGSFLAIGSIAAVIAWAIRLRMHARRRREDPADVPWVNHREENDMIEAGRGATFRGSSIHKIGSGAKSSQDFVADWQPHSDRDIWGPRRSDSYVHSNLADGHAPYMSYLANPNSIHDERIAYPAPLYHGHVVTQSIYPDPNQSIDGRQSASTLGPLMVANSTPGDTSPASSCVSTPTTMYTARTGDTGEYGSRLSLSGPSVPGGCNHTWQPLPLPGQTQSSIEQPTNDVTSWTASLRSNFTQAFNAVAASLPSGPALMIKNQDTRNSQQSLDSFLSRNDSIVCRPWTLEERKDGTGRVLFHNLPSEGYSEGIQLYGSHLTPGSPSRSTSIDPSSTDGDSELVPPRTGELLGPRYGRVARQPSMRSFMSTSSSCSAYSMTSAPRLPALSRHSTIKMDPMTTVYEKKEEDIVIAPQKRPAATTRLSSSGCSVTAYYYGLDAKHTEGEVSTDGDDTIQQTLVDRRKSRRVV
ncbi:hypothetical protein H0H87_008055 [Tephrocybe sp. NHM501043]|nr:hypothetical protein H0H87_008055 [Tephrocybe sp. NHM501043]